LDPEPQTGDAGYEDYIKHLALNSRNKFYRGFLVPPTVDEYRERNPEAPSDRMISRFGGGVGGGWLF
jgi:hypothetical protein